MVVDHNIVWYHSIHRMGAEEGGCHGCDTDVTIAKDRSVTPR